ncbi:MAG: DUF1415 domain-containing protein [Chitinophagaceae bacterium]
MEITELVIQQTRKWITDIVIGCNFCPFAAREMKQNSIHYQVETSLDAAICLRAFLQECIRLDETIQIETSLLIFPEAFQQFDDYLDLVQKAEKLLKKQGYEGIYQVASFHPQYCFAGATADDAANYTNRSIYPMLHLLREERVEQALEKYPDPEQIPQRNIIFAREKGIAYMKILRDACL